MGNYNNTTKSKFINDANIRRDRRLYNVYVSLFEAVSRVEEYYDKDVAEFDSTQLAYLNEDAEIKKLIQLMKYKSALLRYLDWYDNAVANIPLAREWILSYLQPYKKSMVSSPMQLKRALDAAFDPVEAHTIDVIYRAFFWVAFSGLREKYRAETITTDAVDLTNMVIRFDGQKYPIYSEGLADIRAAKELTELASDHVHYLTTWPRFASNKLLRGVKGDANVEGIRRMAHVAFKAAAPNNNDVRTLSYRSVLHSGFFYRQYQEEAMCADNKVYFGDIVPRVVDGVARNEQVWKALRTQTDATLRDEYYVWKYLFYKGIV